MILKESELYEMISELENTIEQLANDNKRLTETLAMVLAGEE